MITLTLNNEIVLAQRQAGYTEVDKSVKAEVMEMLSKRAGKFNNFNFYKSSDDGCYYGQVTGLVFLNNQQLESEDLHLEFYGISKEDFNGMIKPFIGI